jgi:hypothetical protein
MSSSGRLLSRGVHQLESGVDHLADHFLEALRGSPAQFPLDLAGVTALLGRVDRTLEPRVDFDEGTPVCDLTFITLAGSRAVRGCDLQVRGSGNLNLRTNREPQSPRELCPGGEGYRPASVS